MAFPAVVGRNVYDGLADTSHAINIGSPADGTLVVIIARVTTTTTISWPVGWTLLVDNDQTDGSNDATCIAYRLCDGTEGATVTVTTAITGKVSAVAYEITGAANPVTQPPEVSTVATGTSATPDPSSLSPTGGAKDYLWLWLGAWEGEQTSPPTGNPTNYTNPTGGGQSTAGTVVNNCRVAVAERNLNASSEDPPSWTIDAADDWSAWTMAVHPAPSGTNFDETGRLVTITSTVSQTDNLSFGEALTVTVASTLTVTDRADYVQAVATTVTATVTATDSHDASEAVSVSVVATVTAADSLTVPGAVVLVGVGAQVAESSTTQTPGSLTPPLPTGTQVGDILINFIVQRRAGGTMTITPPAGEGWAERAFIEAQNGSGTNRRIWTFWKIHDGSETDPTFECTDESGTPIISGWSNQIAAYRGVNTSAPWDLASAVTDFNNTNENPFTPDAITTLTDGAMALSFVATIGINALELDVGNEQGFTARMSGTAYDTSAGSDHSVGLADKEIVSATTVTMPTWNQTVNGPVAWAAISDALKPLSLGEAVTVTVTATVTVTDLLTVTETVTVTVTATVTATDSLGAVESVTVAIVSTVTATDALSFTEAAAVAIASTVAATDVLSLTEALTVSIVSTVSGTDTLSGGANNYDETGRLVTVTATVTGTDAHSASEAVTVTSTATVTATDQVDWNDALTVTVSSTVTASDILTATDDLAFTIVSTVTGSDILSGAPINYNETGRLVTVVSTVTATDQVDVDENVTVTITSTVTGSDLLGFSEPTTVSIVSTVTGDDLATLTDNVGLTIVCTVTVTDRLTGPTFWETDPAGYTADPAGYTANPVAYVPVGPSDSPPW